MTCGSVAGTTASSVRIDAMDTPTLSFGDVITILKDAEGTLCEISVAPEITRLEWSNIVHFEGVVGHLKEDPPGGDVVLEILSSQGVRSGWSYPAVRTGWIQLSQTRFRATRDSDSDDEPQEFTIWQRGLRLRLTPRAPASATVEGVAAWDQGSDYWLEDAATSATVSTHLA
jgi:hypothetical protein